MQRYPVYGMYKYGQNNDQSVTNLALTWEYASCSPDTEKRISAIVMTMYWGIW